MTYTELDHAIDNAWLAFIDSLFKSNLLVDDLDKIVKVMDYKDYLSGVTDVIMSVVEWESEDD